MYNYLSLLSHVLRHGERKEDRTGTGTRSLFGPQLTFDLSKGFPAVTTKKLPFRLVASELLWFIRGDTNIRFLLQHNNHIWDEWAFKKYVESEDYTGPIMASSVGNTTISREVHEAEMNKFTERILQDEDFAKRHGDLGKIYGKQWRAWGGVKDQLKEVIQNIKTDPNSRRHIVTAWNPSDIRDAALPPCHILYQFNVREGSKLDCKVIMRSADLFLGVPFNIASYALLTHLVARECDLEVGELILSFGDAHIYNNHIPQVKEQRKRGPHPLPTIKIHSYKSMFNIELDDLELVDYYSHPTIKGDISV